MMRQLLVAHCFLVALAQAFQVPSLPARSAVVRNAINSEWTMMPEEPAPEVRSLLACILLPRVMLLVPQSEQ